MRLVRHPGDPAAAWPAGDRELIPGPTGFYAADQLLRRVEPGLGGAAKLTKCL